MKTSVQCTEHLLLSIILSISLELLFIFQCFLLMSLFYICTVNACLYLYSVSGTQSIASLFTTQESFSYGNYLIPKKERKKIWTFNSWKLFFLSLGLRWCYDRKALITRAERLQPKPMAIFQFHVISKWIFFLLPPHPSISVHLFWVWSKVYLN